MHHAAAVPHPATTDHVEQGDIGLQTVSSYDIASANGHTSWTSVAEEGFHLFLTVEEAEAREAKA